MNNDSMDSDINKWVEMFKKMDGSRGIRWLSGYGDNFGMFDAETPETNEGSDLLDEIE